MLERAGTKAGENVLVLGRSLSSLFVDLSKMGFCIGRWLVLKESSESLTNVFLGGPNISKGSSGSVGSAAVQLARSMGANPLESSRRAQNDRTVDISKEALDADIDRITGGSGVAVVLDTVSDPVLFTKAMQALGNGGR